MQDWSGTGQVGCKIGGIKGRKGEGQAKYRAGEMQDRSDVGPIGCRTGGCRTSGIQER